MVLDMYLSRHTYVKRWDHQPEEKKFFVEVTRGGVATHVQPSKVTEVVEEVGYWRKANAIHGWFVYRSTW